MRPFLAAAWGLGALGLFAAGPALAQAEAPEDDVELVADEVVADEIAQTVTASGAVSIPFPGQTIRTLNREQSRWICVVSSFGPQLLQGSRPALEASTTINM